jgi:glutamyl-tRNA synthetase
MSVRVRIAPAPSGSLHVGNARAALYNWLFARGQRGVFVLRIEDTDRSRVTEEAYHAALEDLRWLGLDWDEGPEIGGPHAPYRQSERLDLYRDAAQRLIESGAAYRCYCTREELEAKRRAALAEKRRPGYDGRCRSLTDARRAAFEAEGRPWVLRFRTPDEGSTSFTDLVTGVVTTQHAEIDDFTIMRQDGSPLYNLAVSVDDGLMGMTHVIRGLDIQSSTPRQILLHQALGNPVPVYGHIPLVVGPDRQPLSKRHGDTSVAWYREHGYLPEAVVNYLALLGWGSGDETIFSLDDLVERFSIEDVNASPAMFDPRKLTWMNGEYLRRMDDADLVERIEPWMARAGLAGDPPSGEERARLAAAVPLIKTRMERLDEAPGPHHLRSLFAEVEPDPAAVDKAMRDPHVPELLERAEAALRDLPSWDHEQIKGALAAIQAGMGLKPKTAFQPIRVAISGTTISPPLFESMEVIGRDRSLERLERARKLVGALPSEPGA